MKSLPPLKPRELISILNNLGFIKIRQKGSHIFFKHPDGRTTLVPFHKGEDIGKGLLRQIIKETEISPEEILKILKKEKK